MDAVVRDETARFRSMNGDGLALRRPEGNKNAQINIISLFLLIQVVLTGTQSRVMLVVRLCAGTSEIQTLQRPSKDSHLPYCSGSLHRVWVCGLSSFASQTNALPVVSTPSTHLMTSVLSTPLFALPPDKPNQRPFPPSFLTYSRHSS